MRAAFKGRRWEREEFGIPDHGCSEILWYETHELVDTINE
jgi:hypothetical protein